MFFIIRVIWRWLMLTAVLIAGKLAAVYLGHQCMIICWNPARLFNINPLLNILLGMLFLGETTPLAMAGRGARSFG